MTDLIQGGGSRKRLDITYETLAVLRLEGESLDSIKNNIHALVCAFFNHPHTCIRIKDLRME